MADDFRDQDLVGIDFSDRDLAGAHFENCSLAGASFRHTDLGGATFLRCRAFPEDPDSDASADFAYADLREARFEGCDLTTASFAHASAYDLAFENCMLQGVDFSHGNFSLPVSGVGKAAGLASFRMNGCNFSFGDLSNTYLKDCTLTNNRMIDALLDYCVLAGADLSGSDLNGISGKGLDLVGADLSGASFNTLDPRQISLAGVRMGLAQGLQILELMEISIDPEAG